MSIKWSPEKYQAADVIGREAGLEMLSRLEFMSLKPNTILDIGCGTGEWSGALKKQFPQAQILALDLSPEMINHAPHAEISRIIGDAERLPLRDQSIDLIFANFFVPWCDNFKALLKAWRRILTPNGILMLSALGLDTLQTIPVDIYPRLADVHDLGDCLVTEGFAEPVLDVSYINVTYRSNQKMCEELYATGMITQPHTFINMQTIEDKWHLNYELIIAHAFLASSRQKDGVTHIPLSQIKRPRKNE